MDPHNCHFGGQAGTPRAEGTWVDLGGPARGRRCELRSLADVRTALRDGLDEVLLAEERDGAAGSCAGYFPGVDDLGLGWDACALGVLARFDA